jgi:hypothetical protein
VPGTETNGYSLSVKSEFRLGLAALLALMAWACGGQSGVQAGTSRATDDGGAATDDATGGAATDDAGFETTFQGDGVQCGAIVCSGSQQCCLVYRVTDASNSNPTHACDQDCESVCADICPDAGGMTGTGMPPMGGGGMPSMGGGGMPPMGGGGMPPMKMGPPGVADAAAE